MCLNPEDINKICSDYELDQIYIKEFENETRYRNYGQEVLNSMSNSDIVSILLDKKKELKIYPEKFEWYKTDIEKSIKLINSAIGKLSFELKQRDPDKKTQNTKQMLDNKKMTVNIVELIQSITGLQFPHGTKSNIKCCLPGHEDKTASLHAYEHNGTWKCFGCHKGGTGVDFIMHYKKIPLSEAIRIFLTY